MGVLSRLQWCNSLSCLMHAAKENTCMRSSALQDVLWAIVGLMDAEVTAQGRLESLEPFLGTLVPLLQLLHLPGCTHLTHVSALLMRWVPVMEACERDVGCGPIAHAVRAQRMWGHWEKGLKGQAGATGWSQRS